MERVFKEKPGKRLGGGTKDRPTCERCGRPIKIDSADYERDELLCITCAAELRTPEIDTDYELSGRG